MVAVDRASIRAVIAGFTDKGRIVPKWIASIIGNEADLMELEKSLSGPDLRVSKELGTYVLESVDFNSETDPELVRRQAGRILEILSGASRLAFGLIAPFKVASVAEVRDDGSKHAHVTLHATIAMRSAFSAVVTRQDGTVEKHESCKSADEVPTMTGLAKRNATAAEALRLLGKDENWVNLYRVYEVIARDAGETTLLSRKDGLPALLYVGSSKRQIVRAQLATKQDMGSILVSHHLHLCRFKMQKLLFVALLGNGCGRRSNNGSSRRRSLHQIAWRA